MNIEEIVAFINSIADQIPGWIVIATTIVTSATAITAITPTTADDRFVSAVLRVLNVLAGNVGKNVNKDAPDAPKAK